MGNVRITLTKAHLETWAGSKLIALLSRIAADGKLEDAEIHELRQWLEAHRSKRRQVPAIAWLAEIVEDVLADGVVTSDERIELVLAIERVLPKEEREQAIAARTSDDTLTDMPTRATKAPKVAAAREPKPEPASTPRQSRLATEPQKNYLRSLGIPVPDNMTFAEAGARFADMRNSRSDQATPRQRMVMRFWGREDIAAQGKSAVSDWLDEWYAGDPRRLDAWEAWKLQNPEINSQRIIDRVPAGAGAAVPNDSMSWLVYMFGVAALLLTLAFVLRAC